MFRGSGGCGGRQEFIQAEYRLVFPARKPAAVTVVRNRVIIVRIECNPQGDRMKRMREYRDALIGGGQDEYAATVGMLRGEKAHRRFRSDA